jgi:hypothetical protein
LKRDLRRDVHPFATLSDERLVVEDLKAEPFRVRDAVNEGTLAAETVGGRVETGLFEDPDPERNAPARLEAAARGALTNLSGWTRALSFRRVGALQSAG